MTKAARCVRATLRRLMEVTGFGRGRRARRLSTCRYLRTVRDVRHRRRAVRRVRLHAAVRLRLPSGFDRRGRSTLVLCRVEKRPRGKLDLRRLSVPAQGHERFEQDLAGLSHSYLCLMSGCSAMSVHASDPARNHTAQDPQASDVNIREYDARWHAARRTRDWTTSSSCESTSGRTQSDIDGRNGAWYERQHQGGEVSHRQEFVDSCRGDLKAISAPCS